MSPPLPPFPSLAQRFRFGGQRSLTPRRSPLGSSRPLGWATQSMQPVSLPFRAPLGAQSTLSPVGLFQAQEFTALPDVGMQERASEQPGAAPPDATDTPSAPPQTLPSTASTDAPGDVEPSAQSSDIQPKLDSPDSPGTSSVGETSPLSKTQTSSPPSLQRSPASDGTDPKEPSHLETSEVSGSDRPSQPPTSDSPAPIQRQPKSSVTRPSDQPEASPLDAEQSTASTQGEPPAIQRQAEGNANKTAPTSEPLQDKNLPSASTVSPNQPEPSSAIAKTTPSSPSETPAVQAKAEVSPSFETPTNQIKSEEENTKLQPTSPPSVSNSAEHSTHALSADQKAGQDSSAATIQRREDAAAGNAAIAPLQPANPHTPATSDPAPQTQQPAAIASNLPQLGHPHPILLKPLGSGRSLLKNSDPAAAEPSQENPESEPSENRSILQSKQSPLEPATDAAPEHPEGEQSASPSHPTIQPKHENSYSENSYSETPPLSGDEPLSSSQPLKNSNSQVSPISQTNPAEDATNSNSPLIQRQVSDSRDDADGNRNQPPLLQRRTEPSNQFSPQSSSNKLPESWSDISELLQQSSPIYPESDPVHYLIESLDSSSATTKNPEKIGSDDARSSSNADANDTPDDPSQPEAKSSPNNGSQGNHKDSTPSPEALEQDLERLVYPVYYLLQQQWQWERERQGYGSSGYPLWFSDGEFTPRETPSNENRSVTDRTPPVPGSALYGKLQTLSDQVNGLLRAKWAVEREREGDRPIQFVR